MHMYKRRKKVALFPSIILPYISLRDIYIYIQNHIETFRRGSGVEVRGMYELRGVSRTKRVE
jgi:hypothetical protein